MLFKTPTVLLAVALTAFAAPAPAMVTQVARQNLLDNLTSAVGSVAGQATGVLASLTGEGGQAIASATSAAGKSKNPVDSPSY